MQNGRKNYAIGLRTSHAVYQSTCGASRRQDDRELRTVCPKDTDDASVDSVRYRDYPMIRHLAATVKARIFRLIAETS
jgi:hypothetical protein